MYPATIKRYKLAVPPPRGNDALIPWQVWGSESSLLRSGWVFFLPVSESCWLVSRYPPLLGWLPLESPLIRSAGTCRWSLPYPGGWLFTVFASFTWGVSHLHNLYNAHKSGDTFTPITGRRTWYWAVPLPCPGLGASHCHAQKHVGGGGTATFYVITVCSWPRVILLFMRSQHRPQGPTRAASAHDCPQSKGSVLRHHRAQGQGGVLL